MLIRNTQFRETHQLCGVVRGGERGGGGAGPGLLLFISVPGSLNCAIIKAPSGLLRAATWDTYLPRRLGAPGPGTLTPSFPSVSQVPSVCACPLRLLSATRRFIYRQWKDGLYVIYPGSEVLWDACLCTLLLHYNLQAFHSKFPA